MGQGAPTTGGNSSLTPAPNARAEFANKGLTIGYGGDPRLELVATNIKKNKVACLKAAKSSKLKNSRYVKVEVDKDGNEVYHYYHYHYHFGEEQGVEQ